MIGRENWKLQVLYKEYQKWLKNGDKERNPRLNKGVRESDTWRVGRFQKIERRGCQRQ